MVKYSEKINLKTITLITGDRDFLDAIKYVQTKALVQLVGFKKEKEIGISHHLT